VKKKRTPWIVLAVVIVVGILAAVTLFGGRSRTQYAETVAATGNLTTYYSFSGSLDVDNAVAVTAASATTVTDIYVAPNTVVAKNARLMRLEDGTLVKADIAGEVTSIDVAVNSVVKAGDQLAEIMDLSAMKATFKVDEYDVAAIQIGKTAQITVDGSGSTFEGAITALNKHATVSGDLSYYEATVDLKGIKIPADALPGMQITAKVLNQQAENVVLLKLDAVQFTDHNAPYVLMREGDKVREVSVKVGINDGNSVQITEGLNSGDTVLYTPTSTEAFTGLMGARQYAK